MSATIETGTAPSATDRRRAVDRRRARRIVTRSVAAAALAFAAVAGLAGTGNASVQVAARPTAASTPVPTQHWGALAFSRSTGRVGYSNDFSTERSASRTAAGYCGVSDCRTVVTVRDGCAVLAQASDLSIGYAWSGSLEDATYRALGVTPGTDAHVIGWTCTTGHV